MGNCQNSSPVDNTKTFEKERKNKSEAIGIKAVTWSRNSHGLFDYEARDVFATDLKIKYGGYLVRRQNNSVVMKQDTETAQADDSEILRVTSHETQLWVEPSISKPVSENGSRTNIQENEANEKSVWVVVKSLKSTSLFSKGYKLKEKDLLKLGRVRFRVKEICTDSKKRPTNIHDDFNKGPVFVADKLSMPKVNESQRNLPVCRICLCENSETDNPLVNPCRCAGTMKYVHIKCLQQWLKSRLHTRDTMIAFTIAWKNLDCELCKKTFPSIIEYDGSRFYPLELPRTEADAYIIFEVLSKDSMQVRGLHFINLSVKQSIKLGRGHESDVRIPDISVSRWHANITLDKGSVYINDNDSKFGTLVQLKRKFPLVSELNNIMVQVGRTSMTFSMTSAAKPGVLSSYSLELGQNNSPQNGEKPPTGGLENMADFDLNYGCDRDPKDNDEPDNSGPNAMPVAAGEMDEMGGLHHPVSLVDILRNNPHLNQQNGAQAGEQAQPQNIEDLLYEGQAGASPVNGMAASNVINPLRNDDFEG